MDAITEVLSNIFNEAGLTGIFDSFENIGQIGEDPAVQSILAIFTSLFDQIGNIIGGISL